MRNFNSTLKGSLLLIILLIVYLLWSGLSFSGRIHKFFSLQELNSLIAENTELAISLHNQANILIEDASPGIRPVTGFNPAVFEQDILKLITDLNFLVSDSDISESVILKRKINLVIENASELSRIANELLILIKNKGNNEQGLLQEILTETEKNSSIAREFNTYLLSYNPAILEDLIELLPPEKKIQGTENFEAPQPNEAPLSFLLKELLKTDYKTGYYQKNGSCGNMELISLQIMEDMKSIREEYSGSAQRSLKTYYRKHLIFTILFSSIFIFLVLYFLFRLLKNIEDVRLPLEQLATGALPLSVPPPDIQDFKRISAYTEEIIHNYSGKINFASSLGEGRFEADNKIFSENDELGRRLIKLSEKIKQAREEDLLHKEEEKKRSWHSEGMAGFGEIFRSEPDNLAELSFKVIRKLVQYLNAAQGSIFLINNENQQEIFLESIAAFAFERRKYTRTRIELGVGLAGTCALEKETIYMTDIPPDYITISSGLGESRPSSLLIVPLKLENEIFGVIEIASLYEMRDFEIDFVEHLAESIATTLAGVRINEKTVRLLEQSQLQAKDMLEQEEKMKKSVLALERAQDESRRRENEITGILNAVNASSMVAEFSLNGRFSFINDKFQFLLETGKDQIIGKHHSDFAEVDKYSEGYKKFWKDLREGEIISKTEKYILFSGKEIWLNQTFTPVQDEEGKTIKILNIAQDFTISKNQQDSLEKQALEITRKGMEMRSLSEAVDQSIIKCEYSPDGMVINANMNYCETSGYSLKELIGKNNRLFLKEEEKKQFETIMNEVMKEKPYTGVVKRSRPTGEEIWLMANFTPVKDEGGRIYKIYFLAQDITEKKLKYQLLEDANREIERLKEKLESPENK